MKALTWASLGNVKLVERTKPSIQLPTDAIVRITHASICGTDVHVRDGVHPTSSIGRILGHEGIGYVDEVGSQVRNFKLGDRVIVSCISSCFACENCRRSMPGHCTTGGWQLGNTIDGMQAEYTRSPHADGSLHLIPEDADPRAMILLSDVLTSGYECGVLRGNVRPGSTVAIIGMGPIGLAALVTAQLHSPSVIIAVDTDPNRLRVAKELGADFTINPATGDSEAVVKSLTSGKGCDTVIEAVGIASTIHNAQKIVAIGGVIANIGVHSTKVDLYLEDLWIQNIGKPYLMALEGVDIP